MSGNCPFGYEKATGDRHMLVIAEDEAEIVRRIFALTLRGDSSTQIARRFNEEKVKTPLEFQIEKGRTKRTPKGGLFLWTASAVCRILKNRAYAGDIVYGKYGKDAVGGKNHIRPDCEWQVFCRHHKPIIERDVFEQVQEGRGKKKNVPRRETHPLTGKVVCGCCGRNLGYLDGTTPCFCCLQRYSNALKSDAAKGRCVEAVSVSYLERQVLLRMQEKLGENGEMEKLAQENLARTHEKIKALKRGKQTAVRALEKEKRAHLEEYRRYVLGETEAFHSREKTIHALENEIGELEGEIRRWETSRDRQAQDGGLLYRQEGGTAFKELVERYIGRIVIYNAKEMRIEWKLRQAEAGDIAPVHLSDRRGN